MIGMMNSGAESSVEFYASARHSSLYDNRKRSTQSRTYTPEGRVMINGEPLSPHAANDMWRNVIVKMAAKNFVHSDEKPSGALATIKRLSEKLKRKKSKSPAAMNADLYLDEPGCVKQSTTMLTDPEEKKFVTMIRIESVQQFYDTEPTHRPITLFDEGSVLARLMEESSKIDGEVSSRNWVDDSGKGSMDDDAGLGANKKFQK